MSFRVSTAILTSAGTIDLTDLATVRDDWSISSTDYSDEFLARAITRASAAAAQFCNRVFGAEMVQDTFVRRAIPNVLPMVSDLLPLQLTRRPVLQITSITENGVPLVAGTDYSLDADVGEVFRLDVMGNDRRWAITPIVVTYIGGYVLPAQNASTFPTGAPTAPPDLQDAIGRMVYSRVAESRRDPFVKSTIAYGIGSKEYITSQPDGNLSPDVSDILDNYRVPVVS